LLLLTVDVIIIYITRHSFGLVPCLVTGHITITISSVVLVVVYILLLLINVIHLQLHYL